MCYQHDYESAQLAIDLNTIEADAREECYNALANERAFEVVPERVVCNNGSIWMNVNRDDDNDGEDDMILTSNGWIML